MSLYSNWMLVPRQTAESHRVTCPLAHRRHQDLILTLGLFFPSRHFQFLNLQKGSILVISQVQVLQFVKLALSQPFQVHYFVARQIQMPECGHFRCNSLSEPSYLPQKIITKIDMLDSLEIVERKSLHWNNIVMIYLKTDVLRLRTLIRGQCTSFKGLNVSIKFEPS